MASDESIKKDSIPAAEPLSTVEDEKAAMEDLDQYYTDRKDNLTTIAEYGHNKNPDVVDITPHEYINDTGALDIAEDLRIIAEISILEDDDPSLPAFTVRAVIIGLVRIIFISILLLFFQFYAY
jgi:hypothetical protein